MWGKCPFAACLSKLRGPGKAALLCHRAVQSQEEAALESGKAQGLLWLPALSSCERGAPAEQGAGPAGIARVGMPSPCPSSSAAQEVPPAPAPSGTPGRHLAEPHGTSGLGRGHLQPGEQGSPAAGALGEHSECQRAPGTAEWSLQGCSPGTAHRCLQGSSPAAWPGGEPEWELLLSGSQGPLFLLLLFSLTLLMLPQHGLSRQLLPSPRRARRQGLSAERAGAGPCCPQPLPWVQALSPAQGCCPCCSQPGRALLCLNISAWGAGPARGLVSPCHIQK